jgi:hypothetical protein
MMFTALKHTLHVIPGEGAAAPQTRDLPDVEDVALRLIERLHLHVLQVPALRGCRRSGRDDVSFGCLMLSGANNG